MDAANENELKTLGDAVKDADLSANEFIVIHPNNDKEETYGLYMQGSTTDLLDMVMGIALQLDPEIRMALARAIGESAMPEGVVQAIKEAIGEHKDSELAEMPTEGRPN